MARESMVLVVAFSCAVVAACASSAGNQSSSAGGEITESFIIGVRSDPRAPEFDLPIPVETTWAALPAVYKELGYPGAPATSRLGDRVYITPYMDIVGKLYRGEMNSKYLDCGPAPGGMPAADIYGLTFVIVTLVDPSPAGGSRVRVLVDGNARDRARTSHSVRCAGTGVLEKALADLLAQKAAALRNSN